MRKKRRRRERKTMEAFRQKVNDRVGRGKRYKLVKKKSGIENAGLGVFADQNIPKGQTILNYCGKVWYAPGMRDRRRRIADGTLAQKGCKLDYTVRLKLRITRKGYSKTLVLIEADKECLAGYINDGKRSSIGTNCIMHEGEPTDTAQRGWVPLPKGYVT
ncbi:MAG: SET domain-containing protein, partial [Deltaproteobacteria bacterium]|nr:SET domain-containing protein [Deltaproteobacteria bacterium]